MKIVLSGFMGSGKSIIGQKLSEKLQYKFIDLDCFIENETKMSVSDLFLTKGEIYFRKLEHQIFTDLMINSDDFVLSLGGGTPCYSENHLLLKNPNVISIYLLASVDTLCDRLKNEKLNRPLIANLEYEELEDYVAKSLFERSFFYNQAHLKINIDNKSVAVIVQEIENLLTQNS